MFLTTLKKPCVSVLKVLKNAPWMASRGDVVVILKSYFWNFGHILLFCWSYLGHISGVNLVIFWQVFSGSPTQISAFDKKSACSRAKKNGHMISWNTAWPDYRLENNIWYDMQGGGYGQIRGGGGHDKAWVLYIDNVALLYNLSQLQCNFTILKEFYIMTLNPCCLG